MLLSSSITAEAKPIKINNATTFDFKGCMKSSDGNDVICVGNFRNRDADKDINIYRDHNGSAKSTITDYSGKKHTADEIKTSDGKSCRTNCSYLNLVLVEGVDYQVYFIFKDVSLPSSQIALLEIQLAGAEDIKIRKIPLARQTSSSSEAGDENNSTASRPNSPHPSVKIFVSYLRSVGYGDYKKSWNFLSSDLQRNKTVFPTGYNSFVNIYKDASVLLDGVQILSMNNRQLIVNIPYQSSKNSSRQFYVHYTLNKNQADDNWLVTAIKY
jgi:hypothetical protein